MEWCLDELCGLRAGLRGFLNDGSGKARLSARVELFSSPCRVTSNMDLVN